MAGSSFRAGPELLEDEGFVWGCVWPRVSGGAVPGSSFGLTLHRRRRDGRVVAEYVFDGAIRVFAKLYPDTGAARDVHRIADCLWRHGFGADSPHRVPEPIGCVEEHGVLLMRPAAGDRIVLTEAIDDEALREGMRRTARWVAALHGSPLALGPREDVAHGAFRLTRRAAKAAAARADLEPLFRRLLAELGERSGEAAETGARVQTHGRYHVGHVFMAPDCVTAVDLDRAAVADPAKDVGEFLHVLRWEAAKRRSEVAIDNACRTFLDEYARHRPAALSGLPYYWSYSILWALLGVAFRVRIGRTAWSRRSDFLLAEFDDVPRHAGAWL